MMYAYTSWCWLGPPRIGSLYHCTWFVRAYLQDRAMADISTLLTVRLAEQNDLLLRQLFDCSSLPSKMICELRTLTFHESNFLTRGTELLSNSLFRNKLNNHNLNETIARSYWPWRYSKPWSNFCYHNIPPQLPQVATSGGAPPRPLKINDNNIWLRGENQFLKYQIFAHFYSRF